MTLWKLIPLMYWPHCGHSKTKSEHGRQSTAWPHGRSATHSSAWPHARQRVSLGWKTAAGSEDSRTKSRAGVPMEATSCRSRCRTPIDGDGASESSGSLSWSSRRRFTERYCMMQMQQQQTVSTNTPSRRTTCCCCCDAAASSLPAEDAAAAATVALLPCVISRCLTLRLTREPHSKKGRCCAAASL